MKLLQKIIDCKRLEIFQENFCNGVSLCEAASLQCSDYNFAINRTHHRLFLEYVPKTSCLKKQKREKVFFCEKKSMVNQHLKPCSTQPSILESFSKKCDIYYNKRYGCINYAAAHKGLQ